MKEDVRLLNELKHLLIEDAVDEAFTVLTLMRNTSWYDSFWEEKRKRSGNTQCLAIDFAKYFAVLDGKMKQNEGDHFGKDSDWMIDKIIKVTVWLKEDYSEYSVYHMPFRGDRESVNKETDRRFGKNGWYYFDIDEVKS